MAEVSTPPRRRGTAGQKVERDARLVADRARGLGWTKLGEKYGITVRQCQNIWADRGPSEPKAESDPVAELRDEIDFLDAAIEEYAELAQDTANDSIHLGAIKARVDAQKRRIELKRLYGLLPRDGEHTLMAEIAELFDIVFLILERRGVGWEIQQEIIDAFKRPDEAERKPPDQAERMNRWGRALKAAKALPPDAPSVEAWESGSHKPRPSTTQPLR